MSSPAKVFIIVLNWNNWEDTIACLESLKNLDYSDFEIVVVDNGSTDDSIDRIRQTLGGSDPPEGVRPPRIIENGKNLGFSGGNNVGIRYALDGGADYVLLLNNDTIVEPSFLKILLKDTLGGTVPPRIGILGPRINYFEPKDLIWFNGGKFGWPLRYNYHIDFRKRENKLKNLEPRETDFITGAAMLVKREVFEKIGLLDERFFLYFEDMDFCLRAKKAGFKIVVVPQVKIYHKVSATTSKLKNPVIWYYHVRNYLLLVQKNKGHFLNLATELWGKGIYAKQIIKQKLFPSRADGAEYIKKAVRDFYQEKFGQL